MLIEFAAKTVVVTGAARGIGGAIAEGFAARGARVVALDVLADELDALGARLGAVAGDCETVALDLSDRAAVAERLAGVEADVVVHAAGGVRGQLPAPFEATTPDGWRDIYDANVTSAVNVLTTLVPAMKARGEGRIVTISSGAGLKPSLTGIQAYCSAKHALVGLTRQLALELGPFGITVNSVAPGFLRTSPDYERQWASYGPERQEAMVNAIAMRRLGAPEDIAHAVMFLASPFAGWITGQVLPVSGHPFP
ncbi:short-chain dehydrogenase [Acuticoccus sediminis]|uniref:Short-chain dehydrogenase n=1 Tax=Acuticoccus sediminis TaxID=2184697 RepID=A0A8B2NV42_9HYPH|nr:SDR family NAD(P)-dependent oxidoreductase [Acuticoccus sediminis]RAI00170.1 short-chain dehydrogenase [Acuticoccus sediminis]